jgi:hypothetical protein
VTNYFDELKRRNVLRVGAAYAVVGWFIIEVVDTLAPRMAMPEWVPGFFIIAVLIGFPIVLLLSWAFEMTPEGLKRTVDNLNDRPENQLRHYCRAGGRRFVPAVRTLVECNRTFFE